MDHLHNPKPSPWLDLRVFYIRVSNCEADESIPDHLTVNHIPLTPDTDVEVSGCRISSTQTDFVVSTLTRDRIDKRSEEATFVSTEGVKISGSARFEVYDGKDLLLVGVLELSNGNGLLDGESKSQCKRWSMKCRGVVNSNIGFLSAKARTSSSEITSPSVEVYVAGCFGGTPIVLTNAVQLGNRRKHQRTKAVFDSIPECETVEVANDAICEDPSQLSEYRCYEPETEAEIDYSGVYSRAELVEGEDGELSWFNAGVRVGVGIGLGICLGIGIGVGLMVRSYQATARNLKRRPI